MTPRLQLPAWFAGCVANIQEELQLVSGVFPSGTPSTVLSHALAYTLQTKYNWQVKFCCKSADARLPHTMPVSWVEDVLVVMPAERTYCIVDLNFQAKFVVRCPGTMGEQYMHDVTRRVPSVFIGSLNQLFQEVDLCTTALERLFRASTMTLPPWRTRRTFQQLYKFCLECDATDSSECLRRIGTLLTLGELAADAHECSVGAEHLDCLQNALRASQSVAYGALSFSDAACKSEPMDYDFEKEDSPIVSANSDHSGLSFLLNSQ